MSNLARHATGRQQTWRTTFSLLVALALLARIPELSSADIGDIASASIEASLGTDAAKAKLPLREPLLLDIEASNISFERFLGRTSRVARGHWLPTRAHLVVRTSEVTTCPELGVVTARCRIDSRGTLVRISNVTSADSTGDLLLRVQFLQNGSRTIQESLGGFSTVVRASKAKDHWEVSVVRVAVS